MRNNQQNRMLYGSLVPDFLSGTLISAASVPATLEGANASGVLWQGTPRRFLLNVPEVARYLVEDGQSITIDRSPGVDEAAVVRNLRMAPMAALLYQRGMLAFHAAAAVNERGAILLAGDSGVGKSTLLMLLLQRGWRLLADDLTAVKLDVDGRVVILPTCSIVALWPDSLGNLGIDNDASVAHDMNKVFISPDTRFEPNTTFPLRAVYWLGFNKNDCCDLENVEGIRRFRAMGSLMYNSRIADAQCDRFTYLRFMTALVQAVPLRRLRRPQGKWSVQEMAELVDGLDATLPV